jgi:hypothetical protein
VFAQLRHRESHAGRSRSLTFWRDRSREVDFVVDLGGRVELYEAKWTELPGAGDTVNLDFVARIMGKPHIAGGGIICRANNSFPLRDAFHALPVGEIR